MKVMTLPFKKQSNSLMKRDSAIDLIKTIAIIGVLFIHVCGAANNTPIASFNWLSGNFFGCLFRASVPLFLMSSGVLFLNTDKELPLKKLFLKSILRLVVAMIFWSMVYHTYNIIRYDTLTLGKLFSAFKNVLKFKQEFHLYYIHIMLLIYVLLPILRVFVKNADKRTFQYALTVWFFLGVMFPTVIGFWPFKLLTGIPLQWKLNLVYNSVGYFMLGHYLKKYPLKLYASIISTVLGFAVIYGGTIFMSVKNNSYYTGFIDGMTIGSFFLASGIFSLCYHVVPLMGKIGKGITGYVSKASFCIYLVHMLVLYELGTHNITLSALPMPVIVSAPLMVIICFAASLGIYFVLSFIPVVKKWLI